MKLLLTSFFSLALFIGSAQTRSDVKVYGYVQSVSGGAHPSEVLTEDGGSQKPNQTGEKKNYYIYLTGPAGQRIYPLEIYIQGQQYATKATMIASTPVELKIETGETNPKKVNLVPRTSSQVLMITLSSATPTKTLEAARSLSAENEVVISYKMGGKFYYAVLKELKMLEPAALQ
jgi:hypothetical protein